MSRYLLLLVAILQPLAGAFHQLTGLGQTIGEGDSASRFAADQPMAYAFSIWGVIFLLFLVFGVVAVLQREEKWIERAALPLAIAGALNVVWMIVAQLFYIQPLNFVLLFPILAAAWWAAYRMDLISTMGGSPMKGVANATAGLLSGWLTVAVAISVPQTIRTFTGLGATDYPWPMLWSVVTTALILSYLYTRYISRRFWFFVAVIWGLLAIVLNNYLVTGTWWIGTVTSVVALIVLYLRLTRGAQGAKAGA